MVVEPLIVGLLLMAALMHASWNAILKSDQSDRLATFGVIMTTGTVMGLCAVPFLPWIEAGAWKYLAASVAIHVLYYTFLLKAYSYGDLSHTYPIARGLGPLLVALVSGRFIGEHLRPQDIAGVLLLSFGLIALAMPLRNVVPRPGSRHGLATLFAVLTGFTIAAYIIADGLGVRSAGPTASSSRADRQTTRKARPITRLRRPRRHSARSRRCSTLSRKAKWLRIDGAIWLASGRASSKSGSMITSRIVRPPRSSAEPTM